MIQIYIGQEKTGFLRDAEARHQRLLVFYLKAAGSGHLIIILPMICKHPK
jgi:hypothetical protein